MSALSFRPMGLPCLMSALSFRPMGLPFLMSALSFRPMGLPFLMSALSFRPMGLPFLMSALSFGCGFGRPRVLDQIHCNSLHDDESFSYNELSSWPPLGCGMRCIHCIHCTPRQFVANTLCVQCNATQRKRWPRVLSARQAGRDKITRTFLSTWSLDGRILDCHTDLQRSPKC